MNYVGENIMNELLDKLSSYNLFNYLLPGVLFAALSGHITKYSFIQEDLVVGVFVYYFIGLVISRFGSLVVEPVLKWVTFLRFSNYEDFVSASEQDKKLELLSEANNMYRTITALFFILLALNFYEILETAFPALKEWKSILIIVALLIMFLFAYKKQTQYIVARVDRIASKNGNES